MEKIKILIYALLTLGMLIALFLVYEHFSTSASQFCSFSNSFDCGIVNKSPYANLDGISYLLTIDLGLNLPLLDIRGVNWFFDLITSNAFLGFLTLLLLLIMFHFYRTNKDLLFIKKNKLKSWMIGIFIFSLVYGFYLFLIQHFILKTYCIFCFGLDFVIILSFILILKLDR